MRYGKKVSQDIHNTFSSYIFKWSFDLKCSPHILLFCSPHFSQLYLIFLACFLFIFRKFPQQVEPCETYAGRYLQTVTGWSRIGFGKEQMTQFNRWEGNTNRTYYYVNWNFFLMVKLYSSHLRSYWGPGTIDIRIYLSLAAKKQILFYFANLFCYILGFSQCTE